MDWRFELRPEPPPGDYGEPKRPAGTGPFLGAPSLAASFSHDLPAAFVPSEIFEGRGPHRILRAATRRIAGVDPLFDRLLRSEGIGVLSHSSRVWNSRRVAMLGWIPDFQHRRLPQFFSKRERRQRDATFRRICSRSTLIILSSEACRRDLAEFAPEAVTPGARAPFCSRTPGDSIPYQGGTQTEARYDLPWRYFHLPNQFWAHKNHALVIEALRIVREKGRTGDRDRNRRYRRLPYAGPF